VARSFECAIPTVHPADDSERNHHKVANRAIVKLKKPQEASKSGVYQQTYHYR